jgi:hypothetical protein
LPIINKVITNFCKIWYFDIEGQVQKGHGQFQVQFLICTRALCDNVTVKVWLKSIEKCKRSYSHKKLSMTKAHPPTQRLTFTHHIISKNKSFAVSPGPLHLFLLGIINNCCLLVTVVVFKSLAYHQNGFKSCQGLQFISYEEAIQLA